MPGSAKKLEDTQWDYKEVIVGIMEFKKEKTDFKRIHLLLPQLRRDSLVFIGVNWVNLVSLSLR